MVSPYFLFAYFKYLECGTLPHFARIGFSSYVSEKWSSGGSFFIF